MNLTRSGEDYELESLPDSSVASESESFITDPQVSSLPPPPPTLRNNPLLNRAELDELQTCAGDSMGDNSQNEDLERRKHTPPKETVSVQISKAKGDSVALTPMQSTPQCRRPSLTKVEEIPCTTSNLNNKHYMHLRHKCATQEQEICSLRNKLEAVNRSVEELNHTKDRLQSDLIASEKTRSYQAGLLSRAIVDKEVLASEVKACEQELAEVEIRIQELSVDIQSKEGKIVELTDELDGCRNELKTSESKLEEMSLAFEDFLKERERKMLSKFQETTTTAEAHMRRLEDELDSLRASHDRELRERATREAQKSEEDHNLTAHLRDEIKTLKAQFDTERQQNQSLQSKLDCLTSERDQLAQEAHGNVSVKTQLQFELAKYQARAEKIEGELVASRLALAASEKAAHELSLDRDIANEKNESSYKRFGEMHAQILELNTALQNARQQLADVEEQNKNYVRRNFSLQKKLKQAEKEKETVDSEVKELMREVESSKKANAQLQETTGKLHSELSEVARERDGAIADAKELQRALNRLEKERESNQLDLVEGLRMVGLSTTECREPAPAARSTNPKHDEIGSSVQKHKHGMYVLNVHKATQSLVNKITLLQAENAKVQSRISTQEAHMTEQRTQATCLNDTLIKLEEHLRKTRQENKQLSSDYASVKKQLDNQKAAISKYREIKHTLMEKLARREETLKCMEVAKNTIETEHDAYKRLEMNYDKAKTIIRDLNEKQHSLRHQLDEAKMLLGHYDAKFGRLTEPEIRNSARQQKDIEAGRKRSSSLFAKKASEILAESENSPGQLCVDSFRKHLRKALEVSDSRNPHRRHSDYEAPVRCFEAANGPRPTGDGATN